MSNDPLSDTQPTAPRRGISVPLTSRGFPTWTVYIMAVLGVVYVLNPTSGIFELLPDNLPIVGNLDEGAAYLAIWYGLVEWFNRRRRPPTA